MNDGTLIATTPRAVLRFERTLAAPPEQVWRALTEAQELKAWFPNVIEIDEWRVGATMRFIFEGHDIEPITGTVLECDQPRALAFTWGAETLRFELTADGDGTRLVLLDELDRDAAARNAAGWDVCLDRLAGLTVADDAWKSRFEHYAGEFEPTIGPQAGPPAGYRE